MLCVGSIGGGADAAGGAGVSTARCTGGGAGDSLPGALLVGAVPVGALLVGALLVGALLVGGSLSCAAPGSIPAARWARFAAIRSRICAAALKLGSSGLVEYSTGWRCMRACSMRWRIASALL